MEDHSALTSPGSNSSSFVLPTAGSSTTMSTLAQGLPGTITVTMSLDAYENPILQLGAKTFTEFPKLSAELRVKVWKFTYPERQQITLEHLCYMSGSCNEEKNTAWKQENMQHFPVALHVNHESRNEVLRTCLIIHPAAMAIAVNSTIGLPICAHHSDMYAVQFTTLLYNAGEFHDCLSVLKISQPRLFNKITKLEVRDTLTQFFLLKLFTDNRRSNLGSAGNTRKIYCGSFLLFPALKEITFTGMSTDGNWENLMVKKSLDNLKDWVVRFLEIAKLHFNDGIAPKVIFRPFKTVQEVLEE
ncbi:uncharacterized protein RAG0_05158 [Rhynchosporium agropyri]|uniref:2EXR domain-containing protein n=1 Tax=Rhynchosporium agropyri TaxID=914238 RepID=A0A1E1KC13_9HELO|nr:uncharacterized protein RAG0_05158 [Rhynchosporium agropyri]